MSFDPYGKNPPPDRPADPTAPLDYPADGGTRPPAAAGADRVTLPGIFLIAIGVINLIPAGFTGYQAFLAWTTSAEDMHAAQLAQLKKASDQFNKLPDEGFGRMMKEMTETARKQMEQTDPQALRSTTLWQYGGGTALVALLSLVQVLGGVRMLQLKTYPLCVIAALVSAIPCLSLSGCCLLGQIVGVWAIVVLLNSDVRASFR